jgi:competence/damage-inducible protein CinA-like protein
LIAEIVTIGTELLLGEIVDSNAAHIAQQLAAIGVDHYFTTTVGDNESRIVLALQNALARADVVIATGGLGPTVDDVTREAVARVAGRELVFHPELLEQIAGFFQRRGVPMSANNRRQAYVPAGAMVVENPVGTAPAFVVELDLRAIICLPGVPYEMTFLLQERVLPYLCQRMGEAAVILTRQIHTVGIGESSVDQAITDLMHSRNPTVGTRAHPGQTDVCVTAKATTRSEALPLLADMEKQVRERLGAVVYGVDEETLPGVVIKALRERGLTLALAEAGTPGLIARRLLEVDESAHALAGVRLALSVAELAQDLDVAPAGASEDLARAVAPAVRERYGADLGLAVIEGTQQAPTVCVALAAPDGVHVKQWPSRGRSDAAILWTFHLGLDTLRQWLLARPA